GTDHLSKYNYNLLWCNPISVVILLFSKDNERLVKYYFLANGILLLLLIFGKDLMLQGLRMEFIPIVLALAIRSFTIFYEIKNRLKSLGRSKNPS
ncbi:MAG: hypothetical protein AAF487_14665, partial [Bacteroidota bacterium]